MAELSPKLERVAGASRRTGPSVVEWAILILAGLFALGLALFLAHIFSNFQITPAG
jgi:hypothetical protein